MCFERQIDSAPVESPLDGLEPELLGALPAAELPQASLAPSVGPLANMSPLADPGLAASLAGGATFSEPVQWLLVTAAGLFCAAVGQAVVVSSSGSAAESHIERAADVEATPLTAVTPTQSVAIAPAELGSRTETAVELQPRAIEIAERTASAEVPVAEVPVIVAQQTMPAPDAKSTAPATVQIARKAVVATTTPTAKQVCQSPAPCLKVTRTRRFGSRR